MTSVLRSNTHNKLSLGVALATFIFVSIPLAGAASAPQGSDNRPGVPVFTSADESSAVVELNPAGNPLSPVAEMTGPGGARWFLVKTKNGNVGWIKADNTAEASKVNDHFRALPRDAVVIRPTDNSPPPAKPGEEIGPSASSTPAKGEITIPVTMDGAKVFVPVTFTSGSSSATAVLVVDTGASATMISKRLAMDLRLRSVDTQRGQAVAGSFVADAGQVDSVKVGDAQVNDLRVMIHDGFNDPGSQGLLGFDFLGRFRMSIDAEKKLMVLTPRKS